MDEDECIYIEQLWQRIKKPPYDFDRIVSYYKNPPTHGVITYKRALRQMFLDAGVYDYRPVANIDAAADEYEEIIAAQDARS